MTYFITVFTFLYFSILIGSKYTHKFYREKEIQRAEDKKILIQDMKMLVLKGLIGHGDYFRIISQIAKL